MTWRVARGSNSPRNPDPRGTSALRSGRTGATSTMRCGMGCGSTTPRCPSSSWACTTGRPGPPPPSPAATVQPSVPRCPRTGSRWCTAAGRGPRPDCGSGTSRLGRSAGSRSRCSATTWRQCRTWTCCRDTPSLPTLVPWWSPTAARFGGSRSTAPRRARSPSPSKPKWRWVPRCGSTTPSRTPPASPCGRSGTRSPRPTGAGSCSPRSTGSTWRICLTGRPGGSPIRAWESITPTGPPTGAPSPT